ncbi:nuclease-related domain-containing protein [[Bacillus] enclensis]|uniref:nuclease-related domain-containing protein n=1 Tax=[Bacillus] enclensis TaxID=1402860 RepID=UPI0018DBC634|nr:nuclease-related domain-containing protein [[Bacillus] enclensis]MBH9967959.1 NERD domain-containing protein [[Bacillus] enclensis]
MALVVKRNTAYSRQREEAATAKDSLENEVNLIKANNKKVIWKYSMGGAVLVGVLLYYILPLGLLAGWFAGREVILRKLCRIQRAELKILNQKIKLQSGEAGEIKVSNEIERCLPDSYILLNDLVIPNGRQGTQIDHVLIAPDQIYCIETKDISGKFYPHKQGWLWYPIHSRGNVRKKTVVKNPQHQSSYHCSHLKKILNELQYKFDIKPVVIMTNPRGVWMGKQSEDCPILRIKPFIRYVSQTTGSPQPEGKRKEIAKLLLDFNREQSPRFYKQFQ